MIKAYSIHWKCTYDRKFVILWTDGTWEEIDTGFKAYSINGKTYRQFMDLNKVVSGKMEKDKAIEYINRKIKEGKELGY